MSADSKTYNINMATFDNDQQKEFLALLNNFNITIDVTVTTSGTGWVNYLHTMLRGEAKREFD